MPLGQHAFVKDADDLDAFAYDSIEDHVPAFDASPVARSDLITRDTSLRVPRNPSKACIELRQVPDALLVAPTLEGVARDLQ
jgi:hypothetical protein